MTASSPSAFASIDQLGQALQSVGYFADRRLLTAVFLALRLQRPLLLEGEPGVGKTELAKALAQVLQRQLLRLQCFDGLEQREALYEWNYAAQLIHLRAAEMTAPTLPAAQGSLPPEGALAALGRPGGGSGMTAPTLPAAQGSLPLEGALAALGRPGGGSGMTASTPPAAQGSRADEVEREVYQPRYLIRRPLLQALEAPAPGALLLVDEVDRADEPFEAFLLEYLGEYQVSIPELGTIRAAVPPVTILTSNRTRELGDAIKRRCLYHWLDYPERERELAIVRALVPQAPQALAEQVSAFVHQLRSAPQGTSFARMPGIAETVEWARALVALDTLMLDPEVVVNTAGILFKQRDDVAALDHALAEQTLQASQAAAD